MREDKVLSNARVKFLGVGLGKLIMFLFAVYVARRLGVAYFGKYTFAFAYGSLWTILMDLGMGVAVMRGFAVSRDQGQGLLSASLLLKPVTVLAGLGLLMLTLGFFHLDRETFLLVALIGVGLSLESWLRIAQGAFRGLEDLLRDAASGVIQKVVFVGLSVLLLSVGVHWTIIGHAFVIGYAAALIYGFARLRADHGVRLLRKADPVAVGRVLKVGIPLALVDLFTLVYFRIDTVMLELIRDDHVVGIYNAAYRLIEAAMIVPMAFLTAAFASFARGWEGDRDTLLADYQRSMDYLMAVALPGVAIGLVFAPEVIGLFYGREFIESVLSLRVLLLALLFIYPNYVLTQLLIASNKQGLYAVFVGLCAAVNVGLNLALIPPMGAVGAGIATVATEMILLVCCAAWVRREIGSVSLKKMVLFVLYSVTLGLIASVLKQWNVWISIVVSVFGYLGLVHGVVDLRKVIRTRGRDEDRH